MPTYVNESSEPRLVVDEHGYSQVVQPGHSIRTLRILTEGWWAKMNDEPYDTLTLVETSVAAGASVSGLLGCSEIICTASAAGLRVCPNSESNPGGYTLAVGCPTKIDNAGTIESIHVVGPGGEVFVQGVR